MKPIGCAIAGLLLAACTQPPPAGGPAPVFTASPERFWDAPWPADHRRDDDGTISLRRFPNPHRVPLLDSYLTWLEGTDGFGTNAPIYFPFEGPIDPTRLPAPAESIQRGSPLMLVDVDPTSPEWGRAVPVRWMLNEDTSRYWPLHTLAVSPVLGFPLRPETTYAALVTTDIADPHPGFSEVWSDDHPLHGDLRLLRDVLFLHGLAPADVAVATVFTTTHPLQEMATLARFVRERVEPPDLDLQLEVLDRFSHYTAYRAQYPSPVLTHGRRPYTSSGGGFRFRPEDGQPIIADWDDMRLAVCAPADLTRPPPGGWPVVIYQHGTGGYYRGLCDSNGVLEVGNRLAQAGIVALGIDQPLHGTRTGGQPQSDLANFNILNPESGLSNFRQGALDAIYLARSLASRPWTLRTPEGHDIPLNPEKVLFMGHSQGGITGAIAAPFMGSDLQGAMLSGAGGGLSITVVERKDIVDFAQLIRDLMQFEEGEQVTAFHPIVGLIQTAVEVTDPINYAPYWFSVQGEWPEHRPLGVLATSGIHDEMTAYRTAVAMAAAARLPPLHPAASSADALSMRGLHPEPGPLSLNATAFDGGRVTAALSQWADGDHFVIFRDPEASDLYVDFLRSAADGEPRIGPTQP